MSELRLKSSAPTVSMFKETDNTVARICVLHVMPVSTQFKLPLAAIYAQQVSSATVRPTQTSQGLSNKTVVKCALRATSVLLDLQNQ